MSAPKAQENWPALPLESWADTCATLHLWVQIVGKIRLAKSPRVNHSWNATLYVTSRGLTTTPIPDGERTFEFDFDFIRHELLIHGSDGRTGTVPLEPQSVAAFYRRLMAELGKLDIAVRIHMKPNEVPAPVRFDQDETHAA